MKKIIALCLALILCFSAVAYADTDLSSMTFDELIELRNKISAELTTRPEWKEVTVPAGLYEIGVDIPAGHWTITPADKRVAFNYGDTLNESKTNIAYSLSFVTGGAAKAGSSMSDIFPMESISIELQEGHWIFLDSPSIFTPYIRSTLDFGK